MNPVADQTNVSVGSDSVDREMPIGPR
jgi:hypothetical protein